MVLKKLHSNIDLSKTSIWEDSATHILLTATKEESNRIEQVIKYERDNGVQHEDIDPTAVGEGKILELNPQTGTYIVTDNSLRCFSIKDLKYQYVQTKYVCKL